jgi:BirA family transcriptional regulator, biotin operon repressor / biotin---[acetyl-CoA-carboxylase] ligase
VNSTLGTDWTPSAVARLGPPWCKVRLVASTGSTNADLAALARTGAPSGTVLVAEHQSAGRGRLDRSWTAPPGTSLAISVLLRPPERVPLSRWLWLPLLAGLAVGDAMAEVAGVKAELKWPNDVLIDQRKVCGILAERVVDAGQAAVVMGMGINTRLQADQLPVPTATSLLLAGATVADDEVIAGVLRSLGRWYGRWLGGDDLAEVLSGRCATVGRPVRVELGGGRSVVGEAIGIDGDGRLLVQTDGQVQAFAAGDVVHLR